MALRLAWPTCPSARFRRDGSWERQTCGGLCPRRVGAGGDRLRRPDDRQRTAPAAADPGQRHDHTAGDHRAATADRDRPEPPQQIPQNQHAGQPPVRSKRPLDVVLVTANLTDFDSKLELRGPKDFVSGPLVANGNGSLQTTLPTGVYEVSAADIPSAKPVRFTVGPYRSSSQNDVLLP